MLVSKKPYVVAEGLNLAPKKPHFALKTGEIFTQNSRLKSLIFIVEKYGKKLLFKQKAILSEGFQNKGGCLANWCQATSFDCFGLSHEGLDLFYHLISSVKDLTDVCCHHICRSGYYLVFGVGYGFGGRAFLVATTH